jgi:hypothetical protein
MTIGGLPGFHFHPVIVHDNTATIDLHSHVLEYGHSYLIEIDASVLSHEDFTGVDSTTGWTFTTKASPPAAGAAAVTVAADGSGDFNTLQAAARAAASHHARADDSTGRIARRELLHSGLHPRRLDAGDRPDQARPAPALDPRQGSIL